MTDNICKRGGHFYNMEDCFWRNVTQNRSYHKMKALGYLDLTFCLIMLISNAIIIMVFSRKSVTSPMNRIFTHIAITESLAGLSYTPRAWHEFFHVELCAIPQHRTYFWEEISIFSYKGAFMFRHIGVWMAMMLAVWRYIAVIHPLKERRLCNPEITSHFIKLGYVFGVIMTIPPYFALQVGPAKKLLDKNGCPTSNHSIGNYTIIYEFQVPLENYPILFVTAVFFYGVFLKLLPSIAFTFINYRLIVRLIEVKKQRESMIRQRLDKHTDRTTISLVVILTLFVAGEVPHGLFCVLTVYYGPPFYWKYYHYGMEISNALTLISESFNFIIYYAMSDQFRKDFEAMIRCKTNEFRSITVSGQNQTSRSDMANKLSIDSNQETNV